jgi:hypothetical protein
MEMAGFFMAHAVWCVSSGDALLPLMGYEDHAGWTLMRFLGSRLEAGVERAERWIDRNPKRVVRATLVFDGHFIGGERHTDALGARIVEYSPKPWRAKITLPYRRADSPTGFAVHRPKFRDEGENEDAVDQIMQAFFRGSDFHTEGAAIWRTHLDESL